MSRSDWFLSRIPLPDFIHRRAIRSQLKDRLDQEFARPLTLSEYARKLKEQPITVHTNEANEQHYDVPSSFYELVLGSTKKYSSGYWKHDDITLDESELEMLNLSCERATLQDGQQILELGCGWGSLTLHMAKMFPNASITAVSNSKTQKSYIDRIASERGLKNVSVITADVGQLVLNTQYDRIVSVEMLEHIRNYQQMFTKMASWLKRDGVVFIHIFGHRTKAYTFDDAQTNSWMARHFFTGGQMPAKHLFAQFPNELSIEHTWVISGTHYAQTCHAWLNKMDDNKSKIMPLFHETYGKEAKKFWLYWRLFFMACEELFAFNSGEEWQVYHYQLRHTD